MSYPNNNIRLSNLVNPNTNNNNNIPSTVGKLEITIVEASNLAAKDLNGKSDPYVYWDIFGEKNKTTYIDENLNPKWGESFLYNTSMIELPDKIDFVCMDHDNVGEDDFIGSYSLNLSPIKSGQVIDNWFDLEDVKIKKIKSSKKGGDKSQKKN